MSKIAVMGYGTVGSGVVEVILNNRDLIAKKADEPIDIKYVLDLRDFPGSVIEDKLVKDFDIIKNDPEVEVVVETMGGLHPAYEFVKASILAKKSVCTSNKELVAKYGPELIKIAKENNVNFFFEASVGGGIPIIRPLNQSLTADAIEEITGILNGTTNYILTKMRDDGSDFESVLKEAQELGYAERNPEADICGYDACRKIAILTSLAYGKQVDFEDIYTEGITAITAQDFKYAKAAGAAIKLFGTSRMIDGKVFAMVAPMMINRSHPLYSVDDVFNAIYVRGNMVGDVMFYGKGAGMLPTASAVAADIIDAVIHKDANVRVIWSDEKQELLPIQDAKHRFFVRTEKSDGIEGRVSEVFGEVSVIDAGIEDEYAFITDIMTEKEYKNAANIIDNVVSMIRVDF